MSFFLKKMSQNCWATIMPFGPVTIFLLAQKFFFRPAKGWPSFQALKHAVLAVDDRHVAFCEYNGSVARIICVAVATLGRLANEKLLKCASDNDLLLCRKSTSNKTRCRQ